MKSRLIAVNKARHLAGNSMALIARRCPSLCSCYLAWCALDYYEELGGPHQFTRVKTILSESRWTIDFGPTKGFIRVSTGLT